jgi:hypothetical protein
MDKCSLTKICRLCKKQKSVEEFHWRKKARGYRQSECKACAKEYAREYYAGHKDDWKRYQDENHDHILDCQRERNKHNKERRAQVRREHRKKRPDLYRAADLKELYGMTLGEFAELEHRQENLCAICRKPGVEERYGKLRVDHCHNTGVIRGLLCNKCNVGLGCFGDDATLLKKATAYLENTSDSLGTTV